MSRRTNIASIFGSEPGAAPAASAASSLPASTPVIAAIAEEAAAPQLPAGNRPPQRAAAGPVRKLGENLQRLEDLDRVEAENKALQKALASGAAVVELDTSLIEGSFVRDRFGSAEDLDVTTLVASIEQRGQEVPILVRPHPKIEGRYQVAYGHRRLKALRSLGRKVRAVVREMTDVELIIAQGVENSERQDLSFIERAVFAASLERLEYDREAIMAALTVNKSELSRLIAVAKGIPDGIAKAIGPAPKAGRDRWMTLVDKLAAPKAGKAVEAVIQDPEFAQLDSDARFVRVFTVATAPAPKSSKAGVQQWKSASGKIAAKVTRTDKGTTLFFDAKKDGAAFAEFIERKFHDLCAEFEAEKEPAS
jgi:ParB family chromosome partitioning protein